MSIYMMQVHSLRINMYSILHQLQQVSVLSMRQSHKLNLFIFLVKVLILLEFIKWLQEQEI